MRRISLSLFIAMSVGCSHPISLKQRDREERPSRPSGLSSDTTPNLEPEIKRRYKNGSRATREDFMDQSQEDGSLWASSGQTNYYFTKNRIRNPGDIITLVIDNDLYRDIGLEVKATLSPQEKIMEIEKTREKYRLKFTSNLNSPQKDSGSSPSSAVPAPVPNQNAAAGLNQPPGQAQNNPAATLTPELPIPKTEEEAEKALSDIALPNVDIYSALLVKSGDKMMGEIVERYPNGSYKVKSTKRITYNNGSPRTVSVMGVVKSSDVDEDTDTVNSGKLYEYRVEVFH